MSPLINCSSTPKDLWANSTPIYVVSWDFVLFIIIRMKDIVYFFSYVVTWKFGCATFQQSEARAYCESMGMSPVSLDSPAKQVDTLGR